MVLVLVLVIGSACDRGTAPAAEAPQPREGDAGLARPAPEAARLPDRDEQQRRAEAVRRAAEELALRGVDTREYLMNLVVEDDTYRVAFVRRAGRTLDAQLRVRIRQADFEVLSVEGVPDAGP